MQIKNNYEKQVFNGEVGVIVRIDPIFDDDGNEIESIGVYVKFNGQEIVYSKDELDQLVLAYAVTVHKSQGSEYPAVILVLTTHHYIMLARNIVYTAISRAKNFFVFIGSKKALAIAVKNDTIKKRYTSLSTKLSEELMRNFSMMDKAAVPF
jgi:exodeoxyribonuclease V alpha subunit